MRLVFPVDSEIKRRRVIPRVASVRAASSRVVARVQHPLVVERSETRLLRKEDVVIGRNVKRKARSVEDRW